MNTKSFLTGYFYCVYAVYNHPYISSTSKFSHDLDFYSGQIPLFTKAGRLVIAVNRGICPNGGNTPYAFTNLEQSDFEIVIDWTTPEIWNSIEKDEDCYEVRIKFDELTALIDKFGGLDLEAMADWIVRRQLGEMFTD